MVGATPQVPGKHLRNLFVLGSDRLAPNTQRHHAQQLAKLDRFLELMTFVFMVAFATGHAYAAL